MTLAAGGLWVLALVLAIQPRVVDRNGRHQASASLRHLWQAVVDLGSTSPRVMPVIGIVASAYLLGSVSDAALGSLSRRWAIFVVDRHRRLARCLPWIEPGTYWAGDRRASTKINFLTTALGREWSGKAVELDLDADEPSSTSLAVSESGLGRKVSPRERARLGVQELVRSARDALQADASLQAALAERWGEAEYRLALVFPIVATAVAVALSLPVFVGSCIVAGAVAGTALIGASANHLVESANDDLARWYRQTHPDEWRSLDSPPAAKPTRTST